MSEGFLQVSTTTESEETARALARSSVSARLAACAQVLGPIHSTYWWRDEVEVVDEWLCLLKTTGDRFDALSSHIARNHAYESPEIIATPIVTGSREYLDWVREETVPRGVRPARLV